MPRGVTTQRLIVEDPDLRSTGEPLLNKTITHGPEREPVITNRGRVRPPITEQNGASGHANRDSSEQHAGDKN
ncbi:MAG: hypothetical protein AAFQ71_13480 [Planctomycetota bacterium]